MAQVKDPTSAARRPFQLLGRCPSCGAKRYSCYDQPHRLGCTLHLGKAMADEDVAAAVERRLSEPRRMR